MRHRSALRASAAVAVATAAALVLSACSSGSAEADPDADAPAETVTVKVGTLRGQPHFYHPFLYEEYAPEGVEFEVVTLDTTPALSDALTSGAVDFAITGVTPTIASIAQGRDLKIVASAADGGSGFIGHEGTTVEDLVGKKVGFISGSAQEVALRSILAEHDVDPASLTLQAIPVPEMATAFTTGAIDAFFGVEIGVSIAENAGGVEIEDPYSTPIGKVNIGLATTGALVEEDPELVRKVVDTHVATVEYMTDHIDEWLPEMVAQFGGDQEIFESALENFWLRSDLSDEYQGQLEALAAQMLELGLIPEAPAADDIVVADFAPES